MTRHARTFVQLVIRSLASYSFETLTNRLSISTQLTNLVKPQSSNIHLIGKKIPQKKARLLFLRNCSQKIVIVNVTIIWLAKFRGVEELARVPLAENTPNYPSMLPTNNLMMLNIDKPSKNRRSEQNADQSLNPHGESQNGTLVPAIAKLQFYKSMRTESLCLHL
jgi:hypothetical protein